MSEYLLVDSLRREAQQNNWDRCMTVLSNLLNSLNRNDGIELGIKQMEKYLSIFEKYHPNLLWPRSRISEIRYLGIQDPPQELSEASQEFRTPGSNNFVVGIEHLWFAAQDQDIQSYAKHILEAIGHVLMARVIELAYRDHLENWETRYRYMEVIPETGAWKYPALHDDEAISRKISQDFDQAWEDIKDEETKIWLELCDELENYFPKN